NRIRKPQHHQVLHRLLAEVMVDPEDLAFVEMGGDAIVDGGGAGEVAPDRFLHHHTGEACAAVDRPNHVRAMQADRAGLDEIGRDREVVDAVAGGREVAVDSVEMLAQRMVISGLVEAPAHETQHPRKPVPSLFLDRAAGVLADGIEREGPIRLVIHLLHREADDSGAIGKIAVEGQVVECGQELAMRQRAGAAEDYHRAGGIHRPGGAAVAVQNDGGFRRSHRTIDSSTNLRTIVLRKAYALAMTLSIEANDAGKRAKRSSKRQKTPRRLHRFHEYEIEV